MSPFDSFEEVSESQFFLNGFDCFSCSGGNVPVGFVWVVGFRI